MPADFSALFDMLLVVAGLALVVTGVVMFIRSKTSSQASSVEAFGIKLNVTHPSLILVLAGVGLMVAPRLLPELPGKADKPQAAVVAKTNQPQPAAPAVTPNPEPASQPARPAPPAPVASEVTAAPAVKPAATPPATKPSIPVAQKSPPAKPEKSRPDAAPTVPQRAVPVRALPKIASAPPTSVAATTPEKPAAAKPVEAVSAGPPTDKKTARQTLVYAALGLPTSRSFWSGETRASYTRRMYAGLQQAVREVLQFDGRGLELGQAEFDAWWNESSQHPRSRELCAASNAPLALLAARVETPTTISSVESAYWPELKLRLFVCANQRMYRQQKTLSPQNDDAWPFATEFNGELERYLRTYRSDLADQ
jgi:uncharacterized protein YjeT (DUF2065 family)